MLGETCTVYHRKCSDCSIANLVYVRRGRPTLSLTQQQSQRTVKSLDCTEGNFFPASPRLEP